MVAEWCTKSGTTVVVTPVIDLNSAHRSDPYTPSARIREHVILRDKTCTHPHCTRHARRADLDHIYRYQRGGPPGQTSTENLAPLCRFHHRMKTHAGWLYQFLEPGYYLWRSPQRRRYLRTPHGTIALDNDQGDFLY